MRRVCKAFGVPCKSHSDLCLPLFVLEDDEVDVLLVELAPSVVDFFDTNVDNSLLTVYKSPRPEPRRMLDSMYSPTLAEE